MMEVYFYERMCLYICGILPLILKIVYGQTSEMPDTSTLVIDGVNVTGNRNETHILPTTDGISNISTVTTDGVNVTEYENVTTYFLPTTTMFGDQDQPNVLFLIGVSIASSIAVFLALVICVFLLSIFFDMKKQRELQVQLNYAWGDHGTDHTATVEEGVIMEGDFQNADFVDSANRRRSDIRSTHFNQSSYRRGSEF